MRAYAKERRRDARPSQWVLSLFVFPHRGRTRAPCGAPDATTVDVHWGAVFVRGRGRRKSEPQPVVEFAVDELARGPVGPSTRERVALRWLARHCWHGP